MFSKQSLAYPEKSNSFKRIQSQRSNRVTVISRIFLTQGTEYRSASVIAKNKERIKKG